MFCPFGILVYTVKHILALLKVYVFIYYILNVYYIIHIFHVRNTRNACCTFKEGCQRSFIVPPYSLLFPFSPSFISFRIFIVSLKRQTRRRSAIKNHQRFSGRHRALFVECGKNGKSFDSPKFKRSFKCFYQSLGEIRHRNSQVSVHNPPHSDKLH